VSNENPDIAMVERAIEGEIEADHRSIEQTIEELTRSRDGWKADAEREARNVAFWREHETGCLHVKALDAIGVEHA
jgi:hypothetical protein